jgi:phosphate transport system permease protein
MSEASLTESAKSISRPPSAWETGFDRVFRSTTLGFAWLTIAVVVLILLEIGKTAWPAITEFGPGLMTSSEWDPNADRPLLPNGKAPEPPTGAYGFLPEIWGTLYSSLLGLAIGSAFGIAIAIFLSQDFLPPKVEILMKNIIELLAAIPSVVYGLWGIYVLVPLLHPMAGWLHEHVGWIPLFGTPFQGRGMLPASLVLAIMILPTISAISRDALVSVHPKLKEASLGLGATRWETILAVIVPTASAGIFGSIILAFGRALGETMALAMLVGNTNQLSMSLLSPANTLAALLANHFREAQGIEVNVLMFAALVLLLITLAVNCVGAAILNKASAKLSGVSK